jgi:hypothetical protein
VKHAGNLFFSGTAHFRRIGRSDGPVRQNLGGVMVYLAGFVLLLCMVYLVYAIIDPERF